MCMDEECSKQFVICREIQRMKPKEIILWSLKSKTGGEKPYTFHTGSYFQSNVWEVQGQIPLISKRIYAWLRHVPLWKPALKLSINFHAPLFYLLFTQHMIFLFTIFPCFISLHPLIIFMRSVCVLGFCSYFIINTYLL